MSDFDTCQYLLDNCKEKLSPGDEMIHRYFFGKFKDRASLRKYYNEKRKLHRDDKETIKQLDLIFKGTLEMIPS